MSSLVLNKNYSPLVDRWNTESGDKSYPIWLLLNPKYPAVIYDIWNPILYEIQDKVYRKLHARVDTKNIYIKNTVSNIGIEPNSSNGWTEEVSKEIVMLRESILEHQPKIIITFGTITSEFIRRVFEKRPEIGPQYWSTTNLDHEFERSISNFDVNQTNVIPLIRRTMKKSKLIDERNNFSWEDNEHYFREVGTKIAERIIENRDSLNIWID